MDNTKFGPAKGMRDWLPQETLLRQKLIRLIESHYQLYGFQPIDTPALENIEVLQGKGGGENEKLMFHILKRGAEFKDSAEISLIKVMTEKMNSKISDKEIIEFEINTEVNVVSSSEKIKQSERASRLIEEYVNSLKNSISDMGLRFDLTVPLARYYANHSNELPKPFRCYHIGPVWRADRPQKGRYREFYQCDIDIVGGASDNYEVELLLATDRVLKALGIGKFKIRISDKRLLPALLKGVGVEESKIPGVALSIDKLDKQPLDQVLKEIEGQGHSSEVMNKMDSFIRGAKFGQLDEVFFGTGEADALWKKIDVLRQRVQDVNPEAHVVFDPLLVRGFDYYTGPVFEINVEDKDFTFSIGGGGRYDGLIEKLGGPKGTPAVGISLGFERILLILNEKQKSGLTTLMPKVFVANNGQPEKEILALAEDLRSEGVQVEAVLEGKKIGQQLEAAQKNGFEYAVVEFKIGEETFTVRRLSTRQDVKMSKAELKKALESLKNS